MQRMHSTIQTVLSVLRKCSVDGFLIDHADVLDLYQLWEVVVTKPSPLKLLV
jgi:hypothetical protein